MKISKAVVENPENILTARVEQALLEKLPVDQKSLQRVFRILEPKNLKKIGIAAIGGSALISLISSLTHDSAYKAAVAREMKKQIAPLEQRLEELQAQNELLLQQNRELIARLDKLRPED